MRITRESPIGLSDSGVGGLTVLRAIRKRLPKERFVYFGDTKNVPYGDKSLGEVKRLANLAMDFLQEQGVKTIALACNVSSSVITQEEMKRRSVPVFSLVSYGSQDAASSSRNGKIGVMATRATVQAGLYEKVLKEINGDIKVKQMSCPQLVPLIEAGELDTERVRSALVDYIAPLLEERVDTIILGCTHYPLLLNQMRAICNGAVEFVDPADSLAERLVEFLTEEKLEATEGGDDIFYTSGPGEEFVNFTKDYLGLRSVTRLLVNIEGDTASQHERVEIG